MFRSKKITQQQKWKEMLKKKQQQSDHDVVIDDDDDDNTNHDDENMKTNQNNTDKNNTIEENDNNSNNNNNRIMDIMNHTPNENSIDVKIHDDNNNDNQNNNVMMRDHTDDMDDSKEERHDKRTIQQVEDDEKNRNIKEVKTKKKKSTTKSNNNNRIQLLSFDHHNEEQYDDHDLVHNDHHVNKNSDEVDHDNDDDMNDNDDNNNNPKSLKKKEKKHKKEEIKKNKMISDAYSSVSSSNNRRRGLVYGGDVMIHDDDNDDNDMEQDKYKDDIEFSIENNNIDNNSKNNHRSSSTYDKKSLDRLRSEQKLRSSNRNNEEKDEVVKVLQQQKQQEQPIELGMLNDDYIPLNDNNNNHHRRVQEETILIGDEAIEFHQQQQQQEKDIESKNINDDTTTKNDTITSMNHLLGRDNDDDVVSSSNHDNNNNDKHSDDKWETEILRRVGLSNNNKPSTHRMDNNDTTTTGTNASRLSTNNNTSSGNITVNQLRDKITQSINELHNQNENIEKIQSRKVIELNHIQNEISTCTNIMKSNDMMLEFYQIWRIKLINYIGAIRDMSTKIEVLLYSFHELQSNQIARYRWYEWENDIIHILNEHHILEYVMGRQPLSMNDIIMNHITTMDEFGRDIKSQHILQRDNRRHHKQEIMIQKKQKRKYNCNDQSMLSSGTNVIEFSIHKYSINNTLPIIVKNSNNVTASNDSTTINSSMVESSSTTTALPTAATTTTTTATPEVTTTATTTTPPNITTTATMPSIRMTTTATTNRTTIDGMESDGFISEEEEETFRTRHTSLQKALHVIIDDINEEYTILHNLLNLFQEWYIAYPDEYKQCYAHYTLIDLIGIVIQIELCSLNDPFDESNGYNESKWLSALQYGIDCGILIDNIVSIDRLVDNTILPIIANILDKTCIQLASSKQMISFSKFIKQIEKLYTKNDITNNTNDHTSTTTCYNKNIVFNKIRYKIFMYIKEQIDNISIPIIKMNNNDGTNIIIDEELIDALISSMKGQMIRIKKILMNVLLYWSPILSSLTSISSNTDNNINNQFQTNDNNNNIFEQYILHFISNKFLLYISSIRQLRDDVIQQQEEENNEKLNPRDSTTTAAAATTSNNTILYQIFMDDQDSLSLLPERTFHDIIDQLEQMGWLQRSDLLLYSSHIRAAANEYLH